MNAMCEVEAVSAALSTDSGKLAGEGEIDGARVHFTG